MHAWLLCAAPCISDVGLWCQTCTQISPVAFICTYFKAKDVNDLAEKMLDVYDKTQNIDNSGNNSYYSFYSLDSLRNSYYNIYNGKEL